MKNALRSNEWRWIWVHKTFKSELQKRGPNNSDFLQNWFHPEIRSRFFNLYKFQESDKSSPVSCRMHWNLITEYKLGSTKLLKLKYRTGDQIIQTLYKIDSPQKLASHSLTCRNLKTVIKVLLNYAECIKIKWMTMILPLENF